MSKNFDIITERIKLALNCDSDADLARTLKISTGSFSYMRKKGNIPSNEIINALANHNISLEYIFYGEERFTDIPTRNHRLSTIQIKIYQSTVPSNDISYSIRGVSLDYIEFDTNLISSLVPESSPSGDCLKIKLEASQVASNCMSPTLNQGDVILFDRKQNKIINGKIFIVKLNDELFIKSLYKSSFGIILKSNNPQFPQFEVDITKIEIIGQIVYGFSRFLN